MKVRKAVGEGHYAKNQLLSKDALIGWSHRRRFEVALEMAKPFVGKRVLDYGAGDGTFLALLAESEWSPARCVAADLDPVAVAQCNERLGAEGKLSFLLIEQLAAPEHRGKYDAVFCMEVLEHVVDLEPVLAALDEALAPGGTLIVSVPIETGLPLLVKQTVRRIAGWRNIGDYSWNARYTLRELAASLLARDEQHMTRPIYEQNGTVRNHDHKGFNWRALLQKLRGRFEVERVSFSPLSWSGPQLASQAWFVARRAR
jgi:2-polyprenyl-3-methyl-5-hydroxy-6-metoxy-1,4-benzoquinol methylase